ncbi:hypothetical protein FVEG_10604 [Fusarium verticillioides 7600]|uniref:F-box domain-containing protein n=1 Tax=Gibberella moniliformis (strain M3125 / FGSC 7600) TaxID=334819 RepID=W7N4Z1_GIBM7|nr:hypothetical protein FVEG_10604 [Fusarium verticillioides 7600]EWG51707.1 hypothetical protein FVEG_10604 [Fusarium verticillioides 7600]RBR01109.1 hypothetical protein FVER53263_10604 [Fusarium verticillioides]
MSTRRSARIRNIDLGVNTKPAQSAPAPTASPKRKRKAPAEDEQDEPTTKGKKAPPRKVKATTSKSKVNTTAESEIQKETVPVPDDVLSVLPAEILQQILESVNDPKSMVKMACTSKRYYAIVMAIIHKRISVSTSFWTHIPHVIRRIEPHLSIAQKKQLKRECKYKGQQEKFSTLLDPNAVPPCASNVRQMIIGGIDPGKRHKPFVLRYFEEVLKNLHNLEVFDAEDLTEPMAENLSKLKNLKSIRLHPHQRTIKPEAMAPLGKLGNLEHISIEDLSWDRIIVTDERPFQSMLLNSLSTLQSLEVRTSIYYSDFLGDWEDKLKARNPDALEQQHDFTALKSLTLRGISFEGKHRENVMRNFTRAFDFLKLKELTLMGLEVGQLKFFKYLEDLFTKGGKGSIHLRKLSLQMTEPGYKSNYAETEVYLEGMYRFVSSFDSLTSLEIHDYNLYNSAVQPNPGLSRRLLQSVVKHAGLETLRFHYRHSGSEAWDIPYASAESVEILTKNLPSLRVFEIAPQEDNLDAMARALSHAKNLKNLLCPNFKSYYDDRENAHLNLAKSLLGGFLENASSCEKFAWEEHYKLRRLTMGWTDLRIGSGLKPKKNFEKPVKIEKADRMVMVQNLRPKKWGDSKQVYYTADSRWVDHITRPDRREGPLQLVYDD